jgi:hypothetical protein
MDACWFSHEIGTFSNMKYEIYADMFIAEDFRVFEFVSVGKYGSIPKRIAFVRTELPNVYNLAFGDVNGDDDIDDYSISDNGDRNKILATIVKAIVIYTDKYPHRMIYFRGNTQNRTRLYRMAVGLHLEELSEKFEIYAETEGSSDFLPFYKNMKINAFLIKRKIV